MGNEKNTVKAGPTKDFFVSMITRDIQLSDAIVELIDNSIDGIKRMKAAKYDGFYIAIKFDKDHFEIIDNCGGIKLSIAQEYAFVFGKPPAARDKEEKVETTGTFGIGMKRALFKMGQQFEVISRAAESSFRLSLDVQEWIQKDEAEWEFPLADAAEDEVNALQDCGTTIIVSKLFTGISHSFIYYPFITELIRIIQRRASIEIGNGLEITVNGIKILSSFLSIINGGYVAPYKYSFESCGTKVVVLAGISAERDPARAGWYIYCNNREVLSADKSSITTWKDDQDTLGIIKYHNDYATFRGFVFFTSATPELLPWNTSKTGIDSSSPIYSQTHPHMIAAFSAITSELKKLANLEEETRSAVFQELIKQSPMQVHYVAAQGISEKTAVSFIEPYTEQVTQKSSGIPMTTISYKAEEGQVKKVKTALHVKNNRDVGEKTFEYFINMERI